MRRARARWSTARAALRGLADAVADRAGRLGIGIEQVAQVAGVQVRDVCDLGVTWPGMPVSAAVSLAEWAGW